MRARLCGFRTDFSTPPRNSRAPPASTAHLSELATRFIALTLRGNIIRMGPDPNPDKEARQQHRGHAAEQQFCKRGADAKGRLLPELQTGSFGTCTFFLQFVDPWFGNLP